MSRRLLKLTVLISAVVAVSLPLVWWATRPAADAGSLDRFRNAAVESPPATVVPEGSISVRSARIEDASIGASVPATLRLPSLGVDASIVPVGLEPDGEMEIPKSVATVGWYQPGAVPGRSGSAVLAGHVDSRAEGPGAFFRLGELEPGAPITVVDSRGVEHNFEVTARRQVAKDELPNEIFGSGGDARIALVTCGGDFDATARSYRDNVIVYAVAV